MNRAFEPRNNGNTSPQISVVVPTYNKPQYLQECLRSIQLQTLHDFECIVVSDGSPNAQQIQVCLEQISDQRFRLVEHRKNRGIAATRNTGMNLARATMIMCVDEDDALRPSTLADLFCEIIRSGAAIVCSATQYIGSVDKIQRYMIPNVDEILKRQALPSCGYLILRDTWQSIGGYDESDILRLGREDHEWWIRVVHSGVKIAILNEPLYVYRTPTSDSEQSESLNQRGQYDEVKITKYILEKHRSLYAENVEAKNVMVERALRREVRRYRGDGGGARCARRAWQLWVHRPSISHLSMAFITSLQIVLGPSLIRFLRRIREKLSTSINTTQ